jgi:hypothetical protein
VRNYQTYWTLRPEMQKFPKIKETPLNYRNHKGDLKQVPCRGLINIRLLQTKFSCLGDLAHRICAPLFEMYFRDMLWEILCMLDCSLLYWLVLKSQEVLAREIIALQHWSDQISLCRWNKDIILFAVIWLHVAFHFYFALVELEKMNISTHLNSILQYG